MLKIGLLIAAIAGLNSCSSLSSLSYRNDFITKKDVIFTPASWPSPLVADFYQPASTIPTPAVVLIHGGGWTGSERRSDMVGIANQLVENGYFVMNTTYRLTPEWKFPAQSDDIRQAIQYLRDHARSLNIDPSKIATFGYSAGGHLAALSGLDPKNGVSAIVAGGAPTDLSLWPDGHLTGLLLGGPLKGNETIYRKASPLSHVRRGAPPVFIYHGTSDQLVPKAHPDALIDELRKHHVEHEVYWINGRSHILTHLFSAEAVPNAIKFLDKHLKSDQSISGSQPLTDSEKP